jgi:hypothetical protein
MIHPGVDHLEVTLRIAFLTTGFRFKTSIALER